MVEMQRIKTKVCLVGEAAVGKTSLIRRFVQDDFDDRYITTLGAKVSKREMVFDMPGRKQLQMDITVWGIMGEKGFRELLKEACLHGAKGERDGADQATCETLYERDDWRRRISSVGGESAIC